VEIARRRLIQKLSMSLEEVKSQWSRAGAALSDSPIGDAERERAHLGSSFYFLFQHMGLGLWTCGLYRDSEKINWAAFHYEKII
jgi:hypothetical protein